MVVNCFYLTKDQPPFFKIETKIQEMANLKINVNKAKYQEITEKEKGFRHPLPATLQNISFLFNYKKFPPLMIGDTKVETTRTRFLNMVNNTETRNQAILYLKKSNPIIRMKYIQPLLLLGV